MGLKLKSTGGTGSVQLNCPDNHNLDTSFTLPTTNVTGGEFVLADGSGNVNIDSGTLYVDAVNNRVGIGTTSFDGNWAPRLQVSGTASDGSQGILIENYKPAITFKDISGGSPQRKHIWADNNSLFFGTGDVAQNAQATIDSSGRVGIGTTSVGAKLHVQSGSVSGSPRGGSYTKTLFESSDATTSYWEFQAASTANNDILFSKGNTGSYGIVGYDHSTDALRFHTNSAERMRIGSNGILYLGATGTVQTIANARLQVVGSNAATFSSNSGANQQVAYFHNDATSGNNLFIEFGTETNTVTRGSIDYNRSTGQVRYNVTSDRRLKSDIQPASTALDALSAIQVRSYKWAETGYQVDHGFIAQELNEVAPDAVKVGDDGEEMTDTWAVDNGKLVPLLTKALQEAIAKIETLEADVAALKGGTN